jgi:uncharacterized protein (TIGR03435 family)
MRLALGPILFWVGSFISYSQPANMATEFEVVSVKAVAPANARPGSFRMSGGPGSNEPQRFTAENAAFQNLVRLAYELETYQLVGPDWIQTQRYNVTARVPAGTSREQFRLMLQTLLTQRFALKIHWDSKEMPTYDLTVMKSGPKLKESAPEGTNEPEQPDTASGIAVGPDGYPVLPAGNQPMFYMVPSGKAVRRAHQETMDQTAKQISLQLHSPVIDATGLKGKYDFTLHWMADTGRPQPLAATPDADAGPSLFQAVQQHLGLKLEVKKGSVKVLVVDHAEKTPTEN